MIHPQYWSINSVWRKLKGNRYGVRLSPADIGAYLRLKPRGKAILDIGACDGDSAKLFLDHGARKVICVEKDAGLAREIRLPHTAVYAEEFKPEKHLSLFYDAIKCDIEGYEMLLLPYAGKIKCPIVLEAHNWYVREQFLNAGFEELSKPDEMLGLCLMGKNLE